MTEKSKLFIYNHATEIKQKHKRAKFITTAYIVTTRHLAATKCNSVLLLADLLECTRNKILRPFAEQKMNGEISGYNSHNEIVSCSDGWRWQDEETATPTRDQSGLESLSGNSGVLPGY